MTDTLNPDAAERFWELALEIEDYYRRRVVHRSQGPDESTLTPMEVLQWHEDTLTGVGFTGRNGRVAIVTCQYSRTTG